MRRVIRMCSATPKRLLEISNDGGTLTLSTDAQISYYATLSYCWGGDQPAKTTQVRLNQYKQPFSTEILPATLQDAVQVAHGLGFPHLWVDAMCIVQDDERDVLAQISEMHKIYRGASITIVASRARKSAEGFLQPRVEWRPYALRSLCDNCDNSDSSQLLASPYNYTHDDNPLFTRGWIFQETHLLARLLTFGKRNMGFSCIKGDRADGGYDDGVGSSFVNPGSKDIQSKSHPQAWASLTSIYSRLALSVWPDKLSAVAAFAEEYSLTQEVTEYYTGLWKEDFLWQLLWTPFHLVPGNNRPEPTRAGVYCGPTWSWCSPMAGGVSFPSENPANFQMTCVIENVQIKLLSPANPYGRVTAVTLTIRGKTCVGCSVSIEP